MLLDVVQGGWFLQRLQCCQYFLLEGAGLTVKCFRQDLQCAPVSLVLDRLGRALPVGGAVLGALARCKCFSGRSVTVPNGMFLAIAQKTG